MARMIRAIAGPQRPQSFGSRDDSRGSLRRTGDGRIIRLQGASISTTRLSWAARNGTWIIEDDYDSEYRFGGTALASLQGLDPNGRVIYMGTLTAVMFPALRLGYLVIPQDLIQSFLDVRNATDTLATSVLYQMAMTDFIREGHFSRHLRRMREAYMRTRNALAAALTARRDGLFELAGDEAGMRLLARNR